MARTDAWFVLPCVGCMTCSLLWYFGMSLAVSMQSKGNSALTPTLAPGERENISSVIRQPLNGDWIQCAQRRLPLPGGEGWGEGGTHFQLHGYGLGISSPGGPTQFSEVPE
jgi:hypothetical protein